MAKQQEVARTGNWAKVLFWLGFLVFFAYSFQAIMHLGEVADPLRQRRLVRILAALSKPSVFEAETSREVAAEMWETIQTAFLATTIGAVFAIPLTSLSARPSSFWGRGFNALLQPILSAVRAVHPLIVLTLAVVLAGLGPTAGVLALTLFTAAVLTRDFSEFAQQHTSLSWPVLFKVHFPALALNRLPVSVLIATVLGFMGGGGIGLFLQQHIGFLDYRHASVAILACIIATGGLDLLAHNVWHAIRNHRTSLPSTPEIADLD
jgi:ABC-type phosphate/phosphonate transport system permease subunit